MTSSSAAAIVPITLTVNDRTGLTLYAPPWEDEEGEQWQGFLGDGAKILLYPSTADLAAFIASGEENDLSDHPGWVMIAKSTPDELRPEPADRYDLDEVYELAAGEPDPVHVSKLANIVDMVGRIADCCDDGKLRSLVIGTPAFAELVDDDVTYQGRDGKKRWNELGDTVANAWERGLKRVEDWLNWQGDFTSSDFDAAETLWERIGAEPLEMVFGDATYLTVRGEVLSEADGQDTAVEFLGSDGSLVVFTDVADLAQYCRAATEHRLVKLEWWNELADVESDADFAPETSIDLRKPSSAGAQLLRELAAFCTMTADTDVLDGPSVDKDDWTALAAEIRTAFEIS